MLMMSTMTAIYVLMTRSSVTRPRTGKDTENTRAAEKTAKGAHICHSVQKAKII